MSDVAIRSLTNKHEQNKRTYLVPVRGIIDKLLSVIECSDTVKKVSGRGGGALRTPRHLVVKPLSGF